MNAPDMDTNHLSVHIDYDRIFTGNIIITTGLRQAISHRHTIGISHTVRISYGSIYLHCALELRNIKFIPIT